MRRSIALPGVLLAVTLAACQPTAGTGATTDGAPTATTAADAAPALPAPAPPVPADARAATVERVVDGDTVIVDLDGTRERVRLLRIDTPELARDGDPSECLAEQATAALETLLPAGATVQLQRDVEERDRFDRLLAHLWVDGTWVNGAMLRGGWATVVTFPPNVAHDAEVLAAQTAAVEAGAGLWAAGVC